MSEPERRQVKIVRYGREETRTQIKNKDGKWIWEKKLKTPAKKDPPEPKKTPRGPDPAVTDPS